MGGFVGTDSADTRTDPNGRYAADADQHSPADQQGTRSRISFEHQEAMVKPYLFTDEAMNADNNGTAATNMPTLTIATLANTAELTRPTQAVIEPWTNQLGSWHKQGEPAATKLQPCQTAPRVPWPPPPLPPKLTLTLWSAPLTQQTQTMTQQMQTVAAVLVVLAATATRVMFVMQASLAMQRHEPHVPDEPARPATRLVVPVVHAMLVVLAMPAMLAMYAPQITRAATSHMTPLLLLLTTVVPSHAAANAALCGGLCPPPQPKVLLVNTTTPPRPQPATGWGHTRYEDYHWGHTKYDLQDGQSAELPVPSPTPSLTASTVSTSTSRAKLLIGWAATLAAASCWSEARVGVWAGAVTPHRHQQSASTPEALTTTIAEPGESTTKKAPINVGAFTYVGVLGENTTKEAPANVRACTSGGVPCTYVGAPGPLVQAASSSLSFTWALPLAGIAIHHCSTPSTAVSQLNQVLMLLATGLPNGADAAPVRAAHLRRLLDGPDAVPTNGAPPRAENGASAVSIIMKLTVVTLMSLLVVTRRAVGARPPSENPQPKKAAPSRSCRSKNKDPLRRKTEPKNFTAEDFIAINTAIFRDRLQTTSCIQTVQFPRETASALATYFRLRWATGPLTLPDGTPVTGFDSYSFTLGTHDPAAQAKDTALLRGTALTRFKKSVPAYAQLEKAVLAHAATHPATRGRRVSIKEVNPLRQSGALTAGSSSFSSHLDTWSVPGLAPALTYVVVLEANSVSRMRVVGARDFVYGNEPGMGACFPAGCGHESVQEQGAATVYKTTFFVTIDGWDETELLDFPLSQLDVPNAPPTAPVIQLPELDTQSQLTNRLPLAEQLSSHLRVTAADNSPMARPLSPLTIAFALYDCAGELTECEPSLPASAAAYATALLSTQCSTVLWIGCGRARRLLTLALLADKPIAVTATERNPTVLAEAHQLLRLTAMASNRCTVREAADLDLSTFVRIRNASVRIVHANAWDLLPSTEYELVHCTSAEETQSQPIALLLQAIAGGSALLAMLSTMWERCAHRAPIIGEPLETTVNGSRECIAIRDMRRYPMFAQCPQLCSRLELQPHRWLYVQPAPLPSLAPLPSHCWLSISRESPLLSTGARVAVYSDCDDLWYPAYIISGDAGAIVLQYDDASRPDEHCTSQASPPLLIFAPVSEHPELIEVNAQMSPDVLDLLEGQETDRVRWIHKAASEGFYLEHAALNSQGRWSSCSFLTPTGYKGVKFLSDRRQKRSDGSRSNASVFTRFDPTRRFRLYSTGPCTLFEDYATPEEAALALARANGKLMACPLPRALPVDSTSALLFMSEESPTGYAGVTLNPAVYRKNKYNARLPRKLAAARGISRELGYHPTAEAAALAYAHAMGEPSTA